VSKKPRHLRLVVNNAAPSVRNIDSLFESMYDETVDRFTMLLSDDDRASISSDTRPVKRLTPAPESALAPVPLAPPGAGLPITTKAPSLDTPPAVPDDAIPSARFMTPAAVRNVVAAANRINLLMWSDPKLALIDSQRFEEIRTALQSSTEGIRFVCEEQGSSVHMMKMPSKQSYFWMEFLLREDNIRALLKSMTLAKEAAQAADIKPCLSFVNSQTKLYSVKGRVGGALDISVYAGFIHAPAEVWRQIMHLAAGVSRDNDAILEYSESETFRSVEREIIQMMCMNCNSK
jgi:hypothetical protein